MTQGEWLELTAEIQVRWPHATLTDESLAVWYMDVADLDAEFVRSAVLAIYRDGKEWPPNGAQIRAKVLELARPIADYGEAWSLLCQARSKFGMYAGPGGQLGDEQALAWIAERSPEAAEAVRRFGYRELCTYKLTDEQTVRAQFRDIYRAVSAKAEKAARYAGLPSAGLKALEGTGMKRLGTIAKEITSGDQSAE